MSECQECRSVRNEETVTEVPENSSMKCKELVSVEREKTVTEVPENSSMKCKELVSVGREKTVTEVPENSSNKCKELVSVVLVTASHEMCKESEENTLRKAQIKRKHDDSEETRRRLLLNIREIYTFDITQKEDRKKIASRLKLISEMNIVNEFVLGELFGILYSVEGRNCYSRIDDIKKFYQTLSSLSIPNSFDDTPRPQFPKRKMH